MKAGRLQSLSQIAMSNRGRSLPDYAVHSFVHDARFALRTLLRRRAFTALAVGTLALGIGATTAMYSVVDGVLLRPLPFRDSDRLMAVFRVYPAWREHEFLRRMWDGAWFSYPHFREWQSRQTSFESAGAWATSQMTLTGGTAAEQVGVVRASASLLEVLDVQPVLGRFFLPGEDRPPAARLAVISHQHWQTRFGGSRDALGQVIRLDGTLHEIIGVLPPDLDLSRRGSPSPIWVPAGAFRGDDSPGSTNFLVVGRLRRGVTAEQATDETARIVQGLDPSNEIRARLALWQHETARSARRPLLILLAASGMLLLLACVNVATLLLGESSGRAGEFATRAALGAGRLRVARQLFTEALLLAAGGAVLGAATAAGGARALLALAPTALPGLAQVAIDLRVLGFAAAVAIATALACGLAPIVSLAGVSPGTLLRAAEGRRSTRRREGGVARTLVAIQVALSLVLLVAAGLLGRSLDRLTRIDPGFRTERLAYVALGASGGAYDDAERARDLFVRVSEAMAAAPGVERVAVGSSVPFSGGSSSRAIDVERQPVAEGAPRHEARVSHVMPGFVETLGLRLLAGRLIDARDTPASPPVVVINQTMARRFWPNESALGKRVGQGGEWASVVGVVSDVKHSSLGDTTRATIYYPETQQHTRYLGLLVRSRTEGADISAAIRRAVAAIDPNVPVTRIDAMDDLVARSFAAERFRAALISAFAALAGVLAAVGVYGVTSRAVRRQRREIGIRMALGATPAGTVRLFLGRVSVAVGGGVIVGSLGALAAARLLAPYLFAITPTDPITYAASALALVAFALIASWLPARRAALVSPASVLRQE